MIKKFPSLDKVWTEVNKFRKSKNMPTLTKNKKKLIQYNEVIFNKPINIKPIAIYGYKKSAREVSKKLGIPHYKSAKEFFNSNQTLINNSKSKLFRKWFFNNKLTRRFI